MQGGNHGEESNLGAVFGIQGGDVGVGIISPAIDKASQARCLRVYILRGKLGGGVGQCKNDLCRNFSVFVDHCMQLPCGL